MTFIYIAYTFKCDYYLIRDYLVILIVLLNQFFYPHCVAVTIFIIEPGKSFHEARIVFFVVKIM